MANAAEMIDIYDDDRRFTGERLPRKTKLGKGQYMLYVLALIRNKEGKYLVTQRALDKKWAAGWWEIPGGGAMAGEDSLTALKREVREETGINLTNANCKVLYSYKNYDEKGGDNYFADIYLAEADFTIDDVNVDRNEVIGLALADLDKIKQLHEETGFLHYERIMTALTDSKNENPAE